MSSIRTGVVGRHTGDLWGKTLDEVPVAWDTDFYAGKPPTLFVWFEDITEAYTRLKAGKPFVVALAEGLAGRDSSSSEKIYRLFEVAPVEVTPMPLTERISEEMAAVHGNPRLPAARAYVRCPEAPTSTADFKLRRYSAAVVIDGGSISCASCGLPFFPVRADARHCSPAGRPRRRPRRPRPARGSAAS